MIEILDSVLVTGDTIRKSNTYISKDMLIIMPSNKGLQNLLCLSNGDEALQPWQSTSYIWQSTSYIWQSTSYMAKYSLLTLPDSTQVFSSR